MKKILEALAKTELEAAETRVVFVILANLGKPIPLSLLQHSTGMDFHTLDTARNGLIEKNIIDCAPPNYWFLLEFITGSGK
ncbi:MAG: hypothetical protein GY757_10110 [bacterium]|nr:hypothetical protein [bacterium]